MNKSVNFTDQKQTNFKNSKIQCGINSLPYIYIEGGLQMYFYVLKKFQQLQLNLQCRISGKKFHTTVGVQN